ncbi:MAG: hypothetical protein FWH55_00175 [Oscillospiraceae bacterium]|nr:hypothetical protein [Oscillospiraceae bacterium]
MADFQYILRFALIPSREADDREADRKAYDRKADDREAGDRKADNREAGDKEAGDRKADDREAGDRKADNREADDREAGDRKADNREADDREAGDRMDGMVDFCKTAKIDDVMFFIGCEEHNTGHITMDEAHAWMDVIEIAKLKLAEIGVTTSINPWATLLHADRGRGLRKNQLFELMVDSLGNRASAQVCPLCGEWRQYITELYMYYSGIHPNMIWVEDDFRFHNHHPLHWGGCFCDRHMKLYSDKIGKKVSRNEFVEKLLSPGEPHFFRKIWLDACRDTMSEIAEMIGDAVHKVSPETRVGLMSSNPAVHCAEGRDWHAILKGLAGGVASMVNRPHLPAYGEQTPRDYMWNFNTISRVSRKFVPNVTQIYPELENFPHSSFSKSHALTTHQIESALLLGADGITLNVFDMLGNGVIEPQSYDAVLRNIKGFLSAVKGLGLKPENQKGVKVLISPLSSYTLHTRAGKSMTELYPCETFWAGMLSAYGIANTYSLDTDVKDEIIAVSGQYFRNLSGDDIQSLFESNFVLLDGEAAFTLFDMGFGDLVGIEDAKWHLQESGYQSFEEICNGKTYCGKKNARVSAQYSAGDFLEISYDKNAAPLSIVKDPWGNAVSIGMAVYDDRAIILPYGRFNGGFLTHFNLIRQSVFHDVLYYCSKNHNIAMATGHPYLQVYYYCDTDNRNTLVFVNSTYDCVDEIAFKIPQSDIQNVFILEKSKRKPFMLPVKQDYDGFRIPCALSGMEMKVVYWGEKEKSP